MAKKSKSTIEKEIKKQGIDIKTEKKEAPKIKKMPETFSVSKNLPKIEVLNPDFKIKEIKQGEKEQDEEESEFFNGEFTEEILTAESRGRALPILMSGMIQEKPIDNLEEFADTLPTPETEKNDKGYSASKYGFSSYNSGSNYEKNDKKDYESANSSPQQRAEPDRTFTTPTMQSSATREQESKESLEKFSQQQQYQTKREEENSGPAFRHKERR